MARNPSKPLHAALRHEMLDKRIEILRHVGECGSISEAARQAGVSYKAAWQAIDTLSNLAGTELVQRAVGGTGGGGASLSAAGHELLQTAAMLDQARREVLDRLARSSVGDGIAALGLRTSMRNQIRCTVQRLRAERGAITVHLEATAGTLLRSRITRESAQLLGLAPGKPVLALFKATAVEIRPPEAPSSHANALGGQITRIGRPALGGEAALRLAGGEAIVGFARPASGLRLRDAATAAFDEAAVVVALIA